jgi:uncharacterized membrane protein YfcA
MLSHLSAEEPRCKIALGSSQRLPCQESNGGCGLPVRLVRDRGRSAPHRFDRRIEEGGAAKRKKSNHGRTRTGPTLHRVGPARKARQARCCVRAPSIESCPPYHVPGATRDAAAAPPRSHRIGRTAVKVATLALLGLLVALAAWFSRRWWTIERVRRQRDPSRAVWPGVEDCVVGFVTNFFDALGIGNFAPTTAYYKVRRRVADENIPGTLNVGHSLPVVVEALIFISAVAIDAVTLVTMIGSAVIGAWLGVGIVARLPRRAIQVGMGAALLVAGVLFAAKNVNWLPGGGAALGLHGVRLIFAVAVSFVLGALMMLGIGLYAPCLVLVSLLGMNPVAAFPIMMGSCAFLMPIGGERFARAGRYDVSAALGLTLGGVPAVLIAVYIVKSMPIVWLRWLVVIVVLYAAILMLRSAIRARTHPPTSSLAQ